jgi:hypothetical protein
MDISNLDLGQLKILAYDTGRKLSAYQQDLQVINELIYKKEQMKEQMIGNAKPNITRPEAGGTGSEANKPGNGQNTFKVDKK